MKASYKSLTIFCSFAFAPVWAVCAVLLCSRLSDLWMFVIFAGFMFMPALASILTRCLCHVGFRDMYIRPRFRGNIGRYVLSWLWPIILTITGGLIFFLFFPSLFDTSFSLLLSQGVSEDMLPGVLISNAAAVLVGPLLNLVPAFGEELGWRGYLLPKLMTRMSARQATVVSGLIWGLWHAPMIALGHNYGFDYVGYPWTGIMLMVLFCVFFGVFLSWLTIRTGSVIPAALAHGGINAVAAAGLLFCRPGNSTLLGPTPVGIVGGIPVILAGIFFYISLQKAEQP